MMRIAFVLGSCLVLVGHACAQQPIQWISNTEQGISQARRVQLPIMFYVTGGSGDKGDNIRQAQQAAFRDPTVSNIAHARFVPIRLPLSTQSKDLLEKLGGPTKHGNYLIFATPDLESLGTIPPSNATQAAPLAQQMTSIFRTYRRQLFERELKEKLEKADTAPAEQISILKTIERHLIAEADDSVVKLLDRSDLQPNVRTQAFNTLSTLSTQRAVEALFKAAANDKAASKALLNCQVVAVEYLLPKLNSEDFEEFVAGYEAIVKIANLGRPKPKGFWGGQNRRLIDEELSRVENGAKRAAAAWRQQYEALR